VGSYQIYNNAKGVNTGDRNFRSLLSNFYVVYHTRREVCPLIFAYPRTLMLIDQSLIPINRFKTVSARHNRVSRVAR
jgi:hypothetical protein